MVQVQEESPGVLDSVPGLLGMEFGHGGKSEGDARLGCGACVPRLSANPILAWSIKEPPSLHLGRLSEVVSQV